MVVHSEICGLRIERPHPRESFFFFFFLIHHLRSSFSFLKLEICVPKVNLCFFLFPSDDITLVLLLRGDFDRMISQMEVLMKFFVFLFSLVFAFFTPFCPSGLK